MSDQSEIEGCLNCSLPICTVDDPKKGCQYFIEIKRPPKAKANPLMAFGRFNASKTHCPHGHEYSPENTAIRQGRRVCKACQRLANQANYQRRYRQICLAK